MPNDYYDCRKCNNTDYSLGMGLECDYRCAKQVQTPDISHNVYSPYFMAEHMLLFPAPKDDYCEADDYNTNAYEVVDCKPGNTFTDVIIYDINNDLFYDINNDLFYDINNDFIYDVNNDFIYDVNNDYIEYVYTNVP